MLAFVNLSPLEMICHAQNLGLLTQLLSCTKCNVDMTMKPFERSCDKFAWRCRKCRATKSVRSGSWFSRSHLPLHTVLQITFMWCDRQPYWVVRRDLNIAQNTVMDWYHFCREICVEIMLWHRAKIGGPGKTVELEESKFERPKYNRRKGIEGSWVFGGIECDGEGCFFQIVPNRSRGTIMSLIEEYIEPGTKIVSGIWRAYECLGSEDLEYLKMNYSISFADPESAERSTTEDMLWSRVKQFFSDCNCNKDAFSSFLAEYMYRRLRKNEQCFYTTFVTDIAKVFPLKTDVNINTSIGTISYS